jgi:glutamate synthase domain-containing protein 2
VLAVGADAVYIGGSALLAMVYPQLDGLPAGTNPDQLFLYTGEYVDKLDVEQGAIAVAKFIRASTIELQLLAQTLGKDNIHSIQSDDMVALSHQIAEITGVALAYT